MAIGRAAEQRDEVAPFHCLVSPVLPTERIAHVGGAGDLLRCGIWTRPMSLVGQSRPFDGVCSMSGLPPKAGLGASSRHVAQVPIPDSWNAAKLFARDHLRKNRCTTPKAGPGKCCGGGGYLSTGNPPPKIDEAVFVEYRLSSGC